MRKKHKVIWERRELKGLPPPQDDSRKTGSRDLGPNMSHAKENLEV